MAHRSHAVTAGGDYSVILFRTPISNNESSCDTLVIHYAYDTDDRFFFASWH